MAFADVKSCEAILNAIKEFDEIGRDAFLAKYGYGHAREYFLYYEGCLYDSKAIVGVAHAYEYPDRGPLRSDEFVGGKLTVKRKLEELGFEVRVLSGSWSFEELRRLCRQKGIPESTIYQTSLEWRWRQADFYAEKAQEVWVRLFAGSPVVIGDQGRGDQRWYETIFLYDAYAVACVQALHSLADILSQVVNSVVLRNRLSGRQVSLKNVIKFMGEQGIAPEVSGRIRELLGSKTFSYLDAFCSTVKHRHLINMRFRAQGGDSIRSEAGAQFLAFQYEGNTYPETWGSDILGTYRRQLGQFITGVGLSINEFVAAI